jgi:hypothetical protein
MTVDNQNRSGSIVAQVDVVSAMHVTVKSVANTDSGPVTEFICQYAAGRRTWTVGVPRPNREYDVEFDLVQPLHVGINTKVTNDEVSRIYNSERQITLTARIEDVFENNTASLRFGDSLILVDYEGVFPAIGTWVEVTLSQIEISDTGI